MRGAPALAALLAACSSGAKAPPDYPPLPGDPPRAGAAASPSEVDPGCVPAGAYDVAVDLSAAAITQQHTGMADTEWCEGMLAAVPAHMMASLTIGYEDGRLAVEWPTGTPIHVWPRGACGFEVTTPPMPVRFTFAGGRATGTSTYSIGTQNHPDESCTATDAQVSLVPAAAPDDAPGDAPDDAPDDAP